MNLLTGLKILDFTRYFPGPYATLRLSDWGAEVLKVESLEGEPGRRLNVFNDEEGSVFRSDNRGKRAVHVDLKDPEMLEEVFALVARADVVIEGFRPGVMDRLGLGYEAVRAIKSDIVYCSLSGYGATGPNAGLSGHDINYMALSGCLDQLLDDKGKPVKPQIAFADLVGGICASEAVLAGLVKRGATGQGCYLDISLTESILGMMGLHAVHSSLGYGTHGEMDESISYAVYETADGRYVSLGAMENKFWANFCEAVGRPDLLPAKNEPAKLGNRAYQEMCCIFSTYDFAYWRHFFTQVDCCFAPVLNIEEVLDEPGFKTRGMIGERWGAKYIATHYDIGESFLQEADPFPPLQDRDNPVSE